METEQGPELGVKCSFILSLKMLIYDVSVKKNWFPVRKIFEHKEKLHLQS